MFRAISASVAAFAFCLLLMPAESSAQQAPGGTAFPKLMPMKSFVVQQADQSVLPPPGARQSNVNGKWDSRKRSYSSDASPEDSYREAKLVYVMPGALEPKSSAPGFHFAFDEQLGLTYSPGSFSFSGRGDCLFWQPQTGWGTENINLDMIPLLLRKDYEAIDEPCYEFYWQPNSNGPAPSPFGEVYLNYLFKVPKQSRLVGHAELNVKRQYFDRSFSSEAPHVENGKVLIWDSGSVYAYDSDLFDQKELRGWEKLPDDFKATAFALSQDGSSLAMCAASLKVSCFAPGAAAQAPKWTVDGAAPLIAAGSFFICMNADYSAIQALRMSDGRASILCELPRSLPRKPNSFALAKLGGRYTLFLFVPSQSKTLVYDLSGLR